MSPPNLYVEFLTPKDNGIMVWAFRGCLNHEDGGSTASLAPCEKSLAVNQEEGLYPIMLASRS